MTKEKKPNSSSIKKNNHGKNLSKPLKLNKKNHNSSNGKQLSKIPSDSNTNKIISSNNVHTKLSSHSNSQKPGSNTNTITVLTLPQTISPNSIAGMGNLNTKKLSALQQKFAKKLQGSRFRMINESIYTQSGTDSFQEFQNKPELFELYHAGFREQASQWPENPLHLLISWVNDVIKDPKKVIADMGCGDAVLAQQVKNKVHSFDLISTSPRVIAADIAHVPLPDQSVDIVVFCLSLMGTNIVDFLVEAHRILKKNGILKIVEVRSRFEGVTTPTATATDASSSGGEKVNNKNHIMNHHNKLQSQSSSSTAAPTRKRNDGIKKFLKVVKNIGFAVNNNNNGNNNESNSSRVHLNAMFFMLECIKVPSLNKTTSTSTSSSASSTTEDVDSIDTASGSSAEKNKNKSNNSSSTSHNNKPNSITGNKRDRSNTTNDDVGTESTVIASPVQAGKRDNKHFKNKINNNNNNKQAALMTFSAKPCVYKKR